MPKSEKSQTITPKKTKKPKYFFMGDKRKGKHSMFCGVIYAENTNPQYFFSKDAPNPYVLPRSWKPNVGHRKMLVDMEKAIQSTPNVSKAYAYFWSDTTNDYSEKVSYWSNNGAWCIVQKEQEATPLDTYHLWIVHKNKTTITFTANIFQDKYLELPVTFQKLVPNFDHQKAWIYQNDKKVGHLMINQIQHLINGVVRIEKKPRVVFYGEPKKN